MKKSAVLAALILANLLTSCKELPQISEPPEASSTQDITENLRPAPSEQTDLTPIYDCTAILEAYRSEDPSSLSEKDRAIYDGAVNAISEFYSQDLSEEDAVIAAHDWLVTHVTYDKKMLLPVPKQSKDSENPYGAFKLGQAICMGYTTSFQLLMDMLGIQCIIVRGSSEGEEHAWNMVNLDGNWYHVDVTWDDFVPDEDNRPPFHTYVLVPDSVMEQLHIWDRENSPKAESTDRIYFKTHGLYAQSVSKVRQLLNSAYANYEKYAEIMTSSVDTCAMDHVTSYWPQNLGEYAVTIYWLE